MHLRNLSRRFAILRRSLTLRQKAQNKAWCILLFERFWRRFVPLLLVILLFAVCCWLNLFLFLPVVLHAILLTLFIVAFSAAFVFLCFLHVPNKAEAKEKLEQDNNLPVGRLSLEKQKLSAGSSPATEVLWHEHKKRMRFLSPLKVKAPRPNISAYDIYGLRAAVFLLFVTAFCFQLGGNGGRLSDAFYFGVYQPVSDLRIAAWVNPPDWTDRPPVYLATGSGDIPLTQREAEKQSHKAVVFHIPAGSGLFVQANDNGRGLAALRCMGYDGSNVLVQKQMDNLGSLYSSRLEYSAHCSLTSPLGTYRWEFAVAKDKAPEIAWIKPPERALNGILKLNYTIYDDYGIKKAWAEIEPFTDRAAFPYFARLTAPAQQIKRLGGSLTLWQGVNLPEKKPIEMQKKLSRQKANFLLPPPQIHLRLPQWNYDKNNNLRGGMAETEADLTGSPWGGADVFIRLVAEDAAGQKTYSAPVRLILPQKSFINPVSRALEEQRRLLATDSAAVLKVSAMLDALLLWPEKTIPDKATALALYSLRARLKAVPQVQTTQILQEQAETHNLSLNSEQISQIEQAENRMKDAALRDIITYMGAIAEGIDGSKFAAAEKRLRQAQQALREALRNGASEEEITRLMQDLRNAMQDYIAMLAERNQTLSDGEKNEKTLGESDLERKLKELEDAAKRGQRGTAEQMLAEFEDLMKNLQVRQGNGQGNGFAAKSDKQGQMQKQMDALSDIMRRQQQLLDDTYKKNEQALRGENQSADKETSQQNLQQRQQGLQKDLETLEKQLKSQGLAPKGSFDKAEQDMKSSAEALKEGDTEQAQQNQADSLQALRDDAQTVMEQMRQALAKADAARQAAKSGQKNNALNKEETGTQDPLGRPAGEGQASISGELPQGEAVERARRILEEIRKRLGNLTPQQEKDYLERLLNFE